MDFSPVTLETGRGLVNSRGVEVDRPGGTLLVVAHDLANLDGGVGGPREPGVLYLPDEVVAGMDGFRIDGAERVCRPVGEGAIGTLVRAARYPGG